MLHSHSSSEDQVVHLVVVKVPRGQIHVHLTQETVSAKGVVMPDGEEQGQSPQLLQTDTVLQTQREQFHLHTST